MSYALPRPPWSLAAAWSVARRPPASTRLARSPLRSRGDWRRCEHAVRLQRLDDRQDPADVVDRRAAQMRDRRGGDHRAHAVAGEQLQQQSAVAMAADEMRPPDSVVAGAESTRQVDQDIRRKLGV